LKTELLPNLKKVGQQFFCARIAPAQWNKDGWMQCEVRSKSKADEQDPPSPEAPEDKVQSNLPD